MPHWPSLATLSQRRLIAPARCLGEWLGTARLFTLQTPTIQSPTICVLGNSPIRRGGAPTTRVRGSALADTRLARDNPQRLRSGQFLARLVLGPLLLLLLLRPLLLLGGWPIGLELG